LLYKYITLYLFSVRNLLSIFLLSLYTIATSGAIVQMHYCGSNLAYWDISINNTDTDIQNCCCAATVNPCSGEEKTCCSDNKITLKIQQEYKNTTFNYEIVFLAPALLSQQTYPIFQDASFQTAPRYLFPYPNAPPSIWQNIPLYTLHQSWKLFDVMT
jgi:hypothetical protein